MRIVFDEAASLFVKSVDAPFQEADAQHVTGAGHGEIGQGQGITDLIHDAVQLPGQHPAGGGGDQLRAIPIVTPENQVIQDIEEWQKYVKIPDLRANCSEGWETALENKKRIYADESGGMERILQRAISQDV